jgi:hypothetical protein
MQSMRAPFMERRYAKFDATSFLLPGDATGRCQRRSLPASSRSQPVANYILRADELGTHKAVLVF